MAKKSITFNGKEVPLTKDGFPNAVYLPKEVRAAVKKHREQKKAKKGEELIEDIIKLLEKLSD
jgi:hypothetical protein